MSDSLSEQLKTLLVRRFDRNKNVLGVMLFGSAVRGRFDEFSDIDVFVLLRKRSHVVREGVPYDNRQVDIIYDSLLEAKLLLRNDRFNVRRPISHMLAHGMIVLDRGAAMRVLRKRARQNLLLKTRSQRRDYLMHAYSIDDFWGEVQRDARAKDVLTLGLDCQALIQNALEFVARKHGTYLSRPSETIARIRKFDRTFVRLLLAYYSASSVPRKKRAIGSLVTWLHRKYRCGLPRRWQVSV